MLTRSRAVATAVAMAAARSAAALVLAFVSAVSAVISRRPVVLGRGLVAAEVAEPVGAQDQPLDSGLEVDVGQRGDDGLGAVQRSRGHARGAADQVGGPLVAVLAEADRKHAGHRE